MSFKNYRYTSGSLSKSANQNLSVLCFVKTKFSFAYNYYFISVIFSVVMQG